VDERNVDSHPYREATLHAPNKQYEIAGGMSAILRGETPRQDLQASQQTNASFCSGVSEVSDEGQHSRLAWPSSASSLRLPVFHVPVDGMVA